MKGSPVYDRGHLQIGEWLITEHSADAPQVPGQGSIQRRFEHALFNWHSELTTHSGLQTGGLPM